MWRKGRNRRAKEPWGNGTGSVEPWPDIKRDEEKSKKDNKSGIRDLEEPFVSQLFLFGNISFRTRLDTIIDRTTNCNFILTIHENRLFLFYSDLVTENGYVQLASGNNNNGKLAMFNRLLIRVRHLER